MPEFTSGVEYKTLSCLVYCPAAGGNHARNLNPWGSVDPDWLCDALQRHCSGLCVADPVSS